MPRRRRVLSGLVDQVLSSASNALVLFAAARVTDVAVFGITALGFALLTTALAVGRGWFGTPLLLLGAEHSERISEETRHATAAALMMGVAAGGLTMILGVVTGQFTLMLSLALGAPFLLAQDVHRYSAISGGRPERAVAWDGIWAVGTCILLGATWVDQDVLDVHAVLLIWGALGAASFFGLVMTSRCSPRWLGLPAWWRKSIGHRLRYGLEGGIGATSSLVVVGIAALFVGPAAIAALRGVGTILGPLSVLMAAIPVAVLPDIIRTKKTGRETWRILWKVAVGMSGAALIIGACGFLLPDEAGQLLLGSSWSVVAPLLPIAGLEYAGLAWVSVMYSFLRAQGRSGALLRSRLIHASTGIALGATAAAVWTTASGVAWSLAVTAWLTALLICPPVRPIDQSSC